jgi:drug/metabolite transporter (DMT)-like permease
MGRSILYIILSGISFFCVNFIVKMLGHPENSPISGLQKYPAQELVFFRSLVSFSISFAIIKYRGLPLLGNNRKWLLLRGTSGMIALLLFFFTLHHLPLAIAATIQYLSPIFTAVLASFLFKEQISKWNYVTSILAFAGVCMIGLTGVFGSREITHIDPLWVGIGIVSAILSGLAYNAISKLKDTEETINIVIYFPMLALPITGIWTLFDGVFPAGIEWLLLLLIGIFTQIAQVLMTRAFMLANTALVAPFQYLGAVYALAVGWIVFGEHLEFIHLIGISLVVTGVCLGVVLNGKWKVSKLKRKKQIL